MPRSHLTEHAMTPSMYPIPIVSKLLRAGFFGLLCLAGPGALTAAEVNIYSYREPQLVQPLLTAFTAQTGIKTNLVFAKDGLIERMVAEAANSPVDVLLTNEFGLLTLAKEKGVTQPVTSAAIAADIPAQYRDSEGHWIGLTGRARVVYASKDRVKQEAITLEELAEPKWRGKVCIRSGQYTYNTALFASLILHKGAAWTEQWLIGVKNNLAQKPAGGDRDVAKAIHAGKCDVGIANTYYLGALAGSPNAEHRAWAASIKVLFPNTADRGTHMNITGASLARHAPHKTQGVALLEFLASTQAQALYASDNHEYPLKAGIAWSPAVESWGTFKADTAKLEDIARLRRHASELVDKTNFDAGPGS
jgi:iron(III) transport system substrate-binding protein